MKRHALRLLLFTLAFATALPALADWDQGVAAFREGRFEEAAEVFQAYVQQQPDTPAGHFMLGLTRARQQRMPEALAALDRAVELEAGNLDYRLALAQIQLKARRADAALETLAAQDPGSVPGTHRANFEALLANVATSSGQTDRALRALRSALNANSGSKILWQARAQLANDAPEEKAEALLEIYQIDRSNTEAGRDAVRSLLSVAQSPGQSDSESWYRKALPVARTLATQGNAEDQLRLGETQLGLKDFGAARTAFDAAKTKDASNPYPHYYLATVSLAEKDAEQALEHLTLAEQHQAGAGSERFPELVQLTRASSLRHLERFTDAADVYDAIGRSRQANEMRELRQAQLENDKWEEDRKQCVERRDGLRQLMTDSEDLRGTPEWQNLEDELAAILQACDAYLAAS